MNDQLEIFSGVEDGKATLGEKHTERRRALDTFEAPIHQTATAYVSDEVTANCPITGQPDWYRVAITVTGSDLLIESKSLKLYLQSFRDDGMFCEAFADRIAEDVADAVKDARVEVVVEQKPRGGVSITSSSVVTTGGV